MVTGNYARIVVDDSRLRKRLPKELRKYEKKSEGLARFVAEKTKTKAKAEAPQGSGFLVNLIKVFKDKKPGKYLVRSLNPKSRRDFPSGGKYGAAFNLPRWMHETGGVSAYKAVRTKDGKFFMKRAGAGNRHFKTGNPRYMYAARDYAKKNKTQWAKQYFKRK